MLLSLHECALKLVVSMLFHIATKRFSKNVGIIAVIDETKAPIIIKILKSIGKLSNTSSTLKARNIKINAELNIKPPIKPPRVIVASEEDVESESQ